MPPPPAPPEWRSHDPPNLCKPANEGSSISVCNSPSEGCNSPETCKAACDQDAEGGGDCDAFAIWGSTCYFKVAPEDMRTYDGTWTCGGSVDYYWRLYPPAPPAPPPVPPAPPPVPDNWQTRDASEACKPANEGTSIDVDCETDSFNYGCSSPDTCKLACDADAAAGGPCDAFAVVGCCACYFKTAPQDMREYNFWSCGSGIDYYWRNPDPEPPSAPPTPSAPPQQLFDSAPTCLLGPGVLHRVDDGEALVECETITVQGTLVVGSDVLVRTGRIFVDEGGSVTIGNETHPAANVTIYLEHADCDHLVEDRMSWFSEPEAAACLERGAIEVRGAWSSHGVPRTAWSLASADASDAASIGVEECRGWEIGDRVVVRETSISDDGFPTRRLTSVSHDGDGRACTLGLNATVSVQSDHPASEVMNLERSIRFTGDWHPRSTTDGYGCSARNAASGVGEGSNCEPRNATFTSGDNVYEIDPAVYGGQGIETKAVGAAARLSMKWHAMENCGRVLLGAYCHHLHVVGTGGGTFEGIVVTGSVGKAFTIHSTSGSLIKDSVIWSHRGASVYYENGAEYGNRLEGNVLGCRHKLGGGGWITAPCSLADGVSEHGDSDFREQAGIYLLQPNAADIIGNRAFGFDNAMFVNQQNSGAFGSDFAQGMVPTKAMPFATFSENVFHTNAGFGFYINVHTPLCVRHDQVGRIEDWRDAVPFNPYTGEDQSCPAYLHNHTEAYNVFSAGSYDAMDITFLNFTQIGGVMGCYWKIYRRGLNSGPIIHGGSSDRALILPGGSGLVEIKDYAAPTLSVNHHCALGGVGSICASHYYWNSPAEPHPSLADESPAAISNVVIESDSYGIDCVERCSSAERCRLDCDADDNCDAFAVVGCCACYFKTAPQDMREYDDWTCGIGVDYHWRNAPGDWQTHDDAEECKPADEGTTVSVDCSDECTSILPATYIRDNAIPCFDVAECTPTDDIWLRCPQEWGVRVVRLYSPDRGTLSVTTDDGTYAVPLWETSNGQNSPGIGGYGTYSPAGKAHGVGYSFLVKKGHAVAIEVGGDLADEMFVLEYSEDTWPEAKQTSITLSVSGSGADASGLSGGPYAIASTHSRRWITPYGSILPQAGAWWDAMEADGRAWPTTYDATQYEADRVAFLQARGIWWHVNDEPVPLDTPCTEDSPEACAPPAPPSAPQCQSLLDCEDFGLTARRDDGVFVGVVVGLSAATVILLAAVLLYARKQKRLAADESRPKGPKGAAVATTGGDAASELPGPSGSVERESGRTEESVRLIDDEVGDTGQ